MDLPRIASQTSICPPSIQLMLLTDKPRLMMMDTPSRSEPRTPVSRRLLSASSTGSGGGGGTSGSTATTTTTINNNNNNNNGNGQYQSAEPQFAVLPIPSYQPSRRREEALALQNLRRRLQAVRVLEANRPEPIEARTSCANNNPYANGDLDNRPNLLQKILSIRPVSMILDISDLRTAWQDSDFITDCLCWHNVYRQRHGSPPMSMSSELCYLAQTWANHLAHTNRFYYRNDKDIGQNLFCRPSNALITDVTGQEVATYWYSAFRQYDFRGEPDLLHANVNAGHFTQLVWVSSRRFGVGKARSRSGKIVVVAHYSPVGNVSGAYLENVLPPSAEYYASLHPQHQQQQQQKSHRSMAASTSSTSGSCSRSVSGST